jgi:hypothetical protein
MSRTIAATIELNTAMCLWEAVLEFSLWSENHYLGRREKRTFIANILLEADAGWRLAHQDGKGFDDAFDWDFCPWFLKTCIFESGHQLSLQTDWKDRCTRLGNLHAKDRHDRLANPHLVTE